MAATRAPKKTGRRGRQPGWGTVAQLPSGRYIARWSDPDGKRCQAEQTFGSVSDARAFLATVKADILRRTYRAPRSVSETLSQYGPRWIETRPRIKDSTRHQYEIDFRRHIEPYLGDRVLDRIEPEAVRRWNATLAKDLRQELAHTSRDGTATVARAYRLLRSILQTAVDDELLIRNPCKIAGAGEAKSTERPVLNVQEIAALAAEVPAHYRAFVIVAAFSGLRAGELAALRVSDLVLEDAPAIRVSRRLYRVAGEVTIDRPKSTRGFRTVPIPAFVAEELSRHLAEHRDGAKKSDYVFVTASGRDVLDGYSQVIRRALDRLGRDDVRMHDLRHSALTAAAEHGATLATLMYMAGHSTSNAAQRYQHATAEHARKVAAAMDAAVAAALARPEPERREPSGSSSTSSRSAGTRSSR